MKVKIPYTKYFFLTLNVCTYIIVLDSPFWPGNKHFFIRKLKQDNTKEFSQEKAGSRY